MVGGTSNFYASSQSIADVVFYRCGQELVANGVEGMSVFRSLEKWFG